MNQQIPKQNTEDLAAMREMLVALVHKRIEGGKSCLRTPYSTRRDSSKGARPDRAGLSTQSVRRKVRLDHEATRVSTAQFAR